MVTSDACGAADLSDHWIMVRADCSCTALWNWNGDVISPSKLPIARILQARITAWQARYDEEENKHSGPPPWDYHGGPVAELNAEGRLIGFALKSELPSHWTVVVKDLDGWHRARNGEPAKEWLMTLPGAPPDS